MVQDLGSANGTFVNGERVMEQNLGPGDHIQVGPMMFTMQVNGQPVEISQPEPVKSEVAGKGAKSAGKSGQDLSDSAISEMIDLSEGFDETVEDDEPLANFDLEDSGRLI